MVCQVSIPETSSGAGKWRRAYARRLPGGVLCLAGLGSGAVGPATGRRGTVFVEGSMAVVGLEAEREGGEEGARRR